jgi:predicted HTH transcriptional regulator
LLAEGARYLGLCDKIGKGIDEVYEGVLQNGLGFPLFESGDNHFSARISLEGCAEFREFVKRRAQALTQLDEIIVLRFLFERETARFVELCAAMQRGSQFGHKILSEMFRKNMVEPLSSLNLEWRLTPIVKGDIQNIFKQGQFSFGFGDLYGES